MSTNNYILNLLNIKDENIHIITEWKEKIIKNQKYKIIKSILIYNKRVIFHHPFYHFIQKKASFPA